MKTLLVVLGIAVLLVWLASAGVILPICMAIALPLTVVIKNYLDLY